MMETTKNSLDLSIVYPSPNTSYIAKNNEFETVMHKQKSISFVDCKLSFVNTYFISIVYIIIKLHNKKIK